MRWVALPLQPILRLAGSGRCDANDLNAMKLSGRKGSMPQLDFEKIRKLAEQYRPDMTRFLRDLVRLPSESSREKAVIERIREEMLKVGFDKVEIDPMGNILRDHRLRQAPDCHGCTYRHGGDREPRELDVRIRSKARKPRKRSSAGVPATKRAEWLPWSTRARSSRTWA